MKRRLFKLVVFLLLGAVVNVAVAWGCHRWSSASPEYAGSRPATDSEWQLLEKRRSSRAQGEHGSVAKEAGVGIHRTHLITKRYEARRRIKYDVTWLRAGWPYLSLHSEEWKGPAWGQSTSYWTLPVQTDVGEVSLPLQPLWLGFASNTVFFAALALLITIVPKIVGRHVRFRRKCCLVCGYDLRGDFSAGCSECGWRRASET